MKLEHSGEWRGPDSLMSSLEGLHTLVCTTHKNKPIYFTSLVSVELLAFGMLSVRSTKVWLMLFRLFYEIHILRC